MKRKAVRPRVVGQTQDAGFEIGVRKTFSVSPGQAWDLITSEAGLKLWLGDAAEFRLEKGQPYQTREGAEGEVRVVNPGEHFRLTWRPKDWPKASTIQVRIIPSGGKTVISFHQEQLLGQKQREQMHRRWQKVLEELQALLN